MESIAVREYKMSPQEYVFGLEELLTIILGYVTPDSTKLVTWLLGYRSVGRLLGKMREFIHKDFMGEVGGKMIVNPKNIVGVDQSQRDNVEIDNAFYLDYDLEIDSFVIRSQKTLI